MASNDTPKRTDYSTRPTHDAALLSKLTDHRSSTKSYDSQGNRNVKPPPQNVMQAISQNTAAVTNDLSSMKQLLPDLELAAQILVSSILSPKDMGTPDFGFSVGDGFEAPSESLSGRLLRIIQDYFTSELNINQNQQEILTEILFEKGSYVRIIVPESTVDDVINGPQRMDIEGLDSGSTESISVEARSEYEQLSKGSSPAMLGLLGPGTINDGKSGFSLESIAHAFNKTGSAIPDRAKERYTLENLGIQVLDNPDVVKTPIIQEMERHEAVMSTYGRTGRSSEDLASKILSEFSNEDNKETSSDKKTENKNTVSVQGKTHREIYSSLDSARKQRQHRPITELKSMRDNPKTSRGHPMVMKLPVESIIPAHAPSDPKQHLGYFVLLDMNGYPLNISSTTDHYRELQNAFNSSTSSQNSAVKQVINDLQGNAGAEAQASDINTINEATDAFASVVERDLLNRLQSGKGYAHATLERVDTVYQIMFTRSLKNQRTQILFVPEELTSYMAFYYTNHGIGKSLLEETRILGNMRILTMFSNLMAQVRNSTSRTHVGIDLDANDADPMSTIAQVKDSVMRSRSEQVPLGEGDPSTMIDYLQRAGVDVGYTGHDALPDMEVNIEDAATSHQEVDSDLEDRLRQMQIMAFGISPETVDVSRGVDFATTIVNSSLLLSKRVALYQREYEPMMADFIRKFTWNSETLQTKLLETIKAEANTADETEMVQIMDDFLSHLQINLPRPDTVGLESQLESFDQYRRGLEEALDAWINDNFVDMDHSGDFARKLDQMREAILSYYLRQWLRDNNVFPEMEELTARDEQGNLEFDFGEVHFDHVDALMEFTENYVKRAKDGSARRERRMQAYDDNQEQRLNEEDTTEEEPAADEEGGDEGGLGGLGGEEEEPPAEGGEEEPPAEDEGGGDEEGGGSPFSEIDLDNL